jgi:hypothetical protein
MVCSELDHSFPNTSITNDSVNHCDYGLDNLSRYKQRALTCGPGQRSPSAAQHAITMTTQWSTATQPVIVMTIASPVGVIPMAMTFTTGHTVAEDQVFQSICSCFGLVVYCLTRASRGVWINTIIMTELPCYWLNRGTRNWSVSVMKNTGKSPNWVFRLVM